jgi:hypothetical protein
MHQVRHSDGVLKMTFPEWVFMLVVMGIGGAGLGYVMNTMVPFTDSMKASAGGETWMLPTIAASILMVPLHCVGGR